jgi:hypothetical protein
VSLFRALKSRPVAAVAVEVLLVTLVTLGMALGVEAVLLHLWNPKASSDAWADFSDGLTVAIYAVATAILLYSGAAVLLFKRFWTEQWRRRALVIMLLAPIGALVVNSYQESGPNADRGPLSWLILCLAIVFPALATAIAVQTWRVIKWWFAPWLAVTVAVAATNNHLTYARDAKEARAVWQRWAAPLALSPAGNFDSPLPGYRYVSTIEPANDHSSDDAVNSEWSGESSSAYPTYELDFYKTTTRQANVCVTPGCPALATSAAGPVVAINDSIDLPGFAVDVPGGRYQVSGDTTGSAAMTLDQAVSIFDNLRPVAPMTFMRAVKAANR